MLCGTKLMDTQVNEPTNQNSIKVLKVVSYYKTLGTPWSAENGHCTDNIKATSMPNPNAITLRGVMCFFLLLKTLQ